MASRGDAWLSGRCGRRRGNYLLATSLKFTFVGTAWCAGYTGVTETRHWMWIHPHLRKFDESAPQAYTSPPHKNTRS